VGGHPHTLKQLADSGERSVCGLRGGGEHLVELNRAGFVVEQNKIGEGTADVECNA
jgi:hypothetical protein